MKQGRVRKVSTSTSESRVVVVVVAAAAVVELGASRVQRGTGGGSHAQGTRPRHLRQGPRKDDDGGAVLVVASLAVAEMEAFHFYIYFKLAELIFGFFIFGYLWNESMGELVRDQNQKIECGGVGLELGYYNYF